MNRKMASEDHISSTSTLVMHNLLKGRTPITSFLGLETHLNFFYVQFKLFFLVTFVLGWIKYVFFSSWKLVTNLN